MDPMIKDKDKKQIEELFGELDQPVRLVMFTQEIECQLCGATRQLVQELGALSDKIEVEVHDFVADAELAKAYGVDKIPAVIVRGTGEDEDYGIRFYGIPSGYEFTTLVEDILDVSRRDPGLPEEVMELLARVDQPVHMQAMITPT